MLVTNLTSNYYYLGDVNYYLIPEGTVTVPDDVYNNNTSVAKAVNALYNGGDVDVDSPPSGFPRSTGVSSVDAASSLLAENVQTDDYELVLSDKDDVVVMNKATAVTVTVPPNDEVGFSTGTVISIFQLGAGQVTIDPGDGVTIRSPGSKLKLTGQYSSAALRKRGTDEWVLTGDITVS
jgi:hypothetical protein